MNNATRDLQKEKKAEYSIHALKKRVANSVDQNINSISDLERFLSNWWCRHYSKPYNSKEVLDYTLDELLVEYLELSYHADPDRFRKESKMTKKTTSEDDDNEAWLKKMMNKDYVSEDFQEAELNKDKDLIEMAKEPDSNDEFGERHIVFEEED